MVTVERRHSARVRAYLPVRLYRPGSSVIETLTKNLGTGGLRCVSTSFTRVGQELTLEAPVDIGHQLLSLRGRVAWFRILPESEQYDVGISFIDLPESARVRLRAYLESATSPTA